MGVDIAGREAVRLLFPPIKIAVRLIGGDGNVRLRGRGGAGRIRQDLFGRVRRGVPEHLREGLRLLRRLRLLRLRRFGLLLQRRVDRLRDGRAGAGKFVPFQDAARVAEILRILLARNGAARGIVEVGTLVVDAVFDVAVLRGDLRGGGAARRGSLPLGLLLAAELGHRAVGIQEAMHALFGRELLLLFARAALLPLAAGFLPQFAAGLEAERIIPDIQMAVLRGLRHPLHGLLRIVRGGRLLRLPRAGGLLRRLRRVLRIVRVRRLRGLHGRRGRLPRIRAGRCGGASLLAMIRRALSCRAGARGGSGAVAQADVQKVRRREREQREDDIAADRRGQAHDGIDDQPAERAARRRGRKPALARGKTVAEIGAVPFIRDARDRRRDGVREAEREQDEQGCGHDGADGRLDRLARDERDARIDEERRHDERAVPENAQQERADRLPHRAENGAAGYEHDQRDEREQGEDEPERFAREYARPLIFLVVVFLFSRITQDDLSLLRPESRFFVVASIIPFFRSYFN